MAKPMIKFVIFVLLLVASVSTAEEPPNPAPSIEKPQPKIEKPQLDKSEPQAKQPEIRSVEVKSIPQAPISEQQTSNQEDNASQAVNTNWWFNFLLVILTAGLVCVGFLQVRVYKEQARYMHEGLRIAEQSAKAAQDSADAAKKSAEIAESALRLTERAYIVVNHWDWVDPIGASPGTPGCFLTNSSRTPARLLHYFEVCVVNGRPIDIGLTYRQHLIAFGQDVTIPAQGEHLLRVRQNAPSLPDQWRQIKGGAMPLYAFAHVEYSDVFGDRYEVGCLVTYDSHIERFRRHENQAYNYNRKKNN